MLYTNVNYCTARWFCYNNQDLFGLLHSSEKCILISKRYNQDCIPSGIMPLGPTGNTVYGYATYVLDSLFFKYWITHAETNAQTGKCI